MPENTGPSVRKCGQTAPHQGHTYQALAEPRPVSWTDITPEYDVLTFRCRGVPERARFEAPGYLISVTIREDPDVEHPVLNDGATWINRRSITEEDVRGVHGSLERFASVVARTCAESLQKAMDEEQERRTGKRMLAPEERYRADRRRMDLLYVSPIEEALEGVDHPEGTATLEERRERLHAPGEREVWWSGLAPANPGVCRWCAGRIVYAYPHWTLDADADSWATDPSVCPDARSLGHYHEPEAGPHGHA